MTTKKHDVPESLLAGLLADYQKPEDLIGENGLLKQLARLLVEKALDAEMVAQLGHGKHDPVANAAASRPRSPCCQSADAGCRSSAHSLRGSSRPQRPAPGLPPAGSQPSSLH